MPSIMSQSRKKSALHDASVKIREVIFRYAEQDIALAQSQSLDVIRTIEKAEGLELSADHAPILRIAAAVPMVAAGLDHTKAWTPTELHAMFGRALRKRIEFKDGEIAALATKIRDADLDLPDNPITIAHSAFTVQLCTLFDFEGFSSRDPRSTIVSRCIANTLEVEKNLFTKRTDESDDADADTAMDTDSTATAALLVYNAAYRFYERFLRTMSKQVLPNEARATGGRRKGKGKGKGNGEGDAMAKSKKGNNSHGAGKKKQGIKRGGGSIHDVEEDEAEETGSELEEEADSLRDFGEDDDDDEDDQEDDEANGRLIEIAAVRVSLSRDAKGGKRKYTELLGEDVWA